MRNLQTMLGAMITINHKNSARGHLGSRGFSLIELMIVIAILGILGAAVGVYINSADAKLKAYAFNFGSRFKQAKFEAIKRGHDVYLDFDLDDDGVVDNGYALWVDNNDDTVYDEWDPAFNDTVVANGVCDEGEGDCLIGDPVVFPNQASIGEHGPEIYDGTATGGPGDDGPRAKSVGDGVSAAGNRFRFTASGNCRNNGTAYIYFPRTGGGGKEVAAGPWAVIVSNVGRISLDEWRDGAWKVDQ